MKTARRKQLTKSQVAELESFFGRQCVISGSEDYHWHHLDDDACNTVVCNMVPIGSRFNIHLRDVKQAVEGRAVAPTVLLAQVEPDNLEIRSSLLFSEWDLGRAYGCSRLAVFIAKQYLKEPPDSLIRRGCRALYLTRHRVSYSLMADVLRRDISPYLRARTPIGARTKFFLVRELAGILSEHGEVDKAAELYSLLELGPAKGEPPLDEQGLAAALRRQATTLGAAGEGPGEAKDLLDEALALAEQNLNLHTSVLNSRAWLAIQTGDFAAALDLLEPTILAIRSKVLSPGGFVCPVNVTAWNGAQPVSRSLSIVLDPLKIPRNREAGSASR